MSTVLTKYSGRQPEEKCWRNPKTNVYYLLGDHRVRDSGGCYRINGKIASKPYVVFSDVLGKYIRKTSAAPFLRLTKKGKIVKDYITKITASKEGYEIIVDVDAGEEMFVHNDIDIEENYTMDLYSGKWYTGTNTRYLKEHYSRVEPEKRYRAFNQDLYNFSDVPDEIKRRVEQRSSIIKSDNLYPFAEELYEGLRGLTFGLELETSKCMLPEKFLFEYGFIPVRDGSVPGNEFVSLVFSDQNDVNNAYGFTTKLTRYSTVNNQCSYHVHLGNVHEKVKSKEKKFTAALYCLYRSIQSEALEMQPSYKTDFRTLAKQNQGRGKDYCKPLPSLNLRGQTADERYKKIFRWANDWQQQNEMFNEKTRRHVRAGGNKWNIKNRYYQLNFYNWFFSDSRTIEYRLHHGTVEPDFVMNWLAIVAAITNYTIAHMDQILTQKIKYELDDIVEWAYDRNYANRLKEHIVERKQFFLDLRMREDLGLLSTFEEEGLNRHIAKKQAELSDDVETFRRLARRPLR